jgi:hypothetical protein
MVAKEFGMVYANNFALALTSYLREVAEHLAYRALILVLGPVFFFQKFTETKGSGIRTTAHFPIDHLFEAVDQPRIEMISMLKMII